MVTAGLPIILRIACDYTGSGIAATPGMTVNRYAVYTPRGFAHSYGEFGPGIHYTRNVDDAALFPVAAEAFKVARAINGAVFDVKCGRLLTIAEVEP